MEITRLNPRTLIGYFIFYLVIHVIIFILADLYKKGKINIDKEIDENIKKGLIFMSKWWPAIYLVFLVIFLYGQR
jgi:hypothetical protein